jgi:hypothetical protein
MLEDSELLDSDASHQKSAQPSNRLGTFEWLLIIIGSATLFSATLNATSLLSANDRSRWSTVWSLVELGTYVIDEIDARPGWTTIDKAFHNEHLYSTKPPILATLVAGVYWVLKATFGFDLLLQTDQTTRVILLIVNWLPTTLSFIVFARILRQNSLVAPDDASPQQLPRLVILAMYCFGTLITGYATTLNNHSLAAISVVFTLAPLLRIVSGGSRRGIDFALVGFWAAFVVCNELPAALFGLATFVMLVRRSVKLTAIWYVPTAMIPLIVYFATNWIATGGIKPFYTYYGTEKYLYTLNGVPSYWMNPQGLDRAVDSTMTYLMHCTIGHHGVLSLSPIFLLTVLAWIRPSRLALSRLKPAIVLGAGLTVAVLAFYLSRTSNYNYGGNTYGLRWMIWLIPFWLLAIAPLLDRLLPRRGVCAIVLALLGVSVFTASDASRNPWGESWAYSQMKAAGWIDYSNPPPQFPFKRKLHTWFASLPDEKSSGVWIEYQSSGFGGNLTHRRRDVLRVTNGGRSMSSSGRLVQTVHFNWNTGQSGQWTAVARFDVLSFYDGEPVEKTLLNFESAELTRDALLTFLRGVPIARNYRPGVTRHLRTDARRDAYECQRAATQVNLVRTNRNGKVRISHRTDLWLCDELPFGTARFELTATDTSNGELLTRQNFQVTAVGHGPE